MPLVSPVDSSQDHCDFRSICSGGLTAYGCATRVPDNDIGRLSYYLKCCVVGCGVVDSNLVPAELLDYSNAETLPHHLQATIVRLVFEEFTLERLLNLYIFIDDNHTILPYHASNVFIQSPMDLLSFHRLFLSTILDQQNQHQPLLAPTGKVMICTTSWLNEYYVSPYLQYCSLLATATIFSSTPSGQGAAVAAPPSQSQGAASASSRNSSAATTGSDFMLVDEESHEGASTRTCCQNHVCAHATRTSASTASLDATPYCQEDINHQTIVCDSCKRAGIGSNRYRCTTCMDFDLCETCYFNVEHDLTHVFQRIQEVGSNSRRPLLGQDMHKDVTKNCFMDLDEKQNWNREDCIPFALAIPLDKPLAQRITEDTTCIFLPGQRVRLTGLSSKTGMNDVIGFVQDRVEDRVIIHFGARAVTLFSFP